jgi:hypothetical protein
MNNTVQYYFKNIFYYFLFYIYVYGFYEILYSYLHYIKKINSLTPYKKKYVVKNLVKSINLAALTFYSIPYLIYPAITYHTWDNNIIHVCGLFYSSNDLAALIYVPNLPKTTKNHHQVTVFLSVVSLFIDYNTSSLGRMLFIYSLSSSSSFIVNTYLGSRYICDKKDLVTMKKSARNIYGLSLSINWGWHIYWCVNYYYLLRIQHLLYFLIMFFIVKDDIILFKWLCN